MKLEQQVVSLELAKQLKELGVKQDSLFYWDTDYENGRVIFPNYEVRELMPKLNNRVSAFTVAELGEMLPNQSMDLTVKLYKGNDAYWAECHKWGKKNHLIGGEETEADARAKMLIWLIGEGYITQ